MFIADLPVGINRAPSLVVALKAKDANLVAKGRSVLGICRLASVDRYSVNRVDVDPDAGGSLHLQDVNEVASRARCDAWIACAKRRALAGRPGENDIAEREGPLVDSAPKAMRTPQRPKAPEPK